MVYNLYGMQQLFNMHNHLMICSKCIIYHVTWLSIYYVKKFQNYKIIKIKMNCLKNDVIHSKVHFYRM